VADNPVRHLRVAILLSVCLAPISPFFVGGAFAAWELQGGMIYQWRDEYMSISHYIDPITSLQYYTPIFGRAELGVGASIHVIGINFSAEGSYRLTDWAVLTGRVDSGLHNEFCVRNQRIGVKISVDQLSVGLSTGRYEKSEVRCNGTWMPIPTELYLSVQLTPQLAFAMTANMAVDTGPDRGWNRWQPTLVWRF